MKKIYLIIIIAFVLLFSTCTKDKEPSQLEIFIHNVETTDFSALIEGEYVYDNEIKDLYLLYGKDSSLIDGTTKKKVDLQEKRFSVVINDLLSNTQYYYCIEYSSKYSNFKTKIYDFVTQEIEEPSTPDNPDVPDTPEEPDDSNNISSVITSDITDITSSSAVCGGIVVSEDMTIITSCGVCWNTSSKPTINDSHTSDEITNGTFISELTNLEANTIFYVRAYATTEKGVTYGEQKEFVTLKVIDVPTVTTSIISNITETEATVGGNVLSDGGASVTEKGICWSTSPNPTIENDHTVDGFGLGNFVSYMQGLTHNTKYYVRAYAINEIGISYGEQREFTTLINIVAPEVTTNDITAISPNSATCGGNVISDGNAEVIAKGVCWSTSPDPTIYHDHTTDGNGLGSYVSYLSNLKHNTKYYIRAYATNVKGTAYGEEKEFTTLAELPVVTTNDIGEAISSYAICGGSIIDDGGLDIIARGVCWSTIQNPTISDNYTIEGVGVGSFTSTITDLDENTTYYVRAYATNVKGTGYGEIKAFSTKEITLPIVLTNDISDITSVSAVCGGNVTYNGYSVITDKGICWSTSLYPTIMDDYISDNGESMEFVGKLISLTDNTTYYVRAYATNEKGTSYGDTKIFMTNGIINGYEFVDLGLPSGLKWAAYNVGATLPEEYGDYYAWGETETKSEYTIDNSITHGVPMSDISGNPQYDVARAKWNGTWRMPTRIELQELEDNCTKKYVTINGINGFKLIGPNGNSIFLPAAGFRENTYSYYGNNKGYYWGGTPYNGNGGSKYDYSCSLIFENYISIPDFSRCCGCSIRPVSE